MESHRKSLNLNLLNDLTIVKSRLLLHIFVYKPVLYSDGWMCLLHA